MNSRNFILSAMALALTYSFIVAFSVLGPFLIQVNLGYTPAQYGHFSLLIGFACLFGSVANRYFLKRVEADALLLKGVLFFLTIAIVMLGISVFTPLAINALLIFVFLMLFPVGIVYPNFSARCLSMFKQQAGAASAVMGLITIAGTSLVSVLIGFLSVKTMIPLAVIYCLLSIALIFLCLLVITPKIIMKRDKAYVR